MRRSLAKTARISVALRALVMLIFTISQGIVLDGFGADTSYLVKRGDTLSGIARNHGLSTSALAERNGLSRSAHIYAGQRLVIPEKREEAKRQSSAGATPPSALPTSVQRAVARAPVRPGRWKYVVIHHSGVDTGTVKAMDRYHREERHMENGLAYHFVIGNGNGMSDGQVSVGQRWTRQLDGGHLASEGQNRVAIGICLVGNFDRRGPTNRQMQSLQALLTALMARCQLSASAVKTHREINVVGTRCPGTKFPTAALRSTLKSH